MTAIDEQTVAAAWEEMNTFSPERGRTEVARVARAQPALLPFVLAALHDCRPAAQELGVYLCYVVLRIFEKGTPKRIPPVTEARMEQGYEEYEARLQRLQTVDQPSLAQAAAVQTARQPQVVRFIVEAITETPDDGDDAVALTEVEKGALFLTLMTLIDVLDEACARIAPA